MEWALIGTADDIIRGIQIYMDVDVTHFMFNFAVLRPEDLRVGIKRFGEEVMPSFK
jgi:hypothetical protein